MAEEQQKILVVDDELDIRELIAGLLEDEGHEVRSAADSDAELGGDEGKVPQVADAQLEVVLVGGGLDLWLLVAAAVPRKP